MQQGSAAWAGREGWLTIVTLVLVFQAALVLLHEPWLDEWQSLQIAIQSPNFAELLANLRYEGHPPLYYLLLRATATIVPLPWVLTAVQLPITLALQSVILFKSFAQRQLRLCFALSAYVLIDYGAIARSLSLGVLIFLIAWAFRQRRWAWAAVICLPAVDFLFGVLSIICLWIFYRERNWSWAGGLLWLASAAFAAWTVIPAPDVVPALVPPREPVIAALVFLANLAQLLVPLPISEHGLHWNVTFPVVLACVTGFLAIVAAWWMKPAQRSHQIALGAFAAVCLLFSLFIYMIPIRQLSLIALLLIALRWREGDMGAAQPRLFSLWMAITAGCGLLLGCVNLVQPFNTSAQAALWLRQSGLMDKHWVSVPDNRAQGIAALNDMRFTRLGDICQQQFVRWNNGQAAKADAVTVQQLRMMADSVGQFYIVSDARIRFGTNEIQQIGHVPGGFDDQDFYFYRFAPHLPETASRPRTCHGDTKTLPASSLQIEAKRERARHAIRKWLGLSPMKGEIFLEGDGAYRAASPARAQGSLD